MEWAEEELRGISLGDTRLNKRCIKLLGKLGEAPQQSIPSSCKSWKETIGAYRLLSHEKVSSKKVLKPHVAAMKKRAQKEKAILCIQDTTEIDYSSHTAKKGI